MGDKEQGYLDLSPSEKDYRILLADKLLTETPPEKRMYIMKEMFLAAAKNHKDETACALLEMIGKEYHFQEIKIADKTDKHYSDANQRAKMAFGDYLREVYWELPDREKAGTKYSDSQGKYIPVFSPSLLKTKVYILKVCIDQWASYCGRSICFAEVDENSKKIFSFLIDAYNGLNQRYVSKEEHDEILELFSKKTDSYFTPEILEKWLSWEYSAIPKEIQKIFLIARARNGGMDLFKRDIKNAEILKPLDVSNRSEAALEFHQKFCAELTAMDLKIMKMLGEFKPNRVQIKKIEIEKYECLNEIFIKIYIVDYRKMGTIRAINDILSDFYSFLSKQKQGRYVTVHYSIASGEESMKFINFYAQGVCFV